MSFFANNFNIPPGSERKTSHPPLKSVRTLISPLLHTIVPKARYAMTKGHCYIQLGCCKPPSGSRAEPWWGSRGRSPWKLQKHCSSQYLKIGRNVCSWLTFYCILQTLSQEKILIYLDLLREKIGESPIKTHEFHHFFEKYGL